jgi:hypothetical protein
LNCSRHIHMYNSLNWPFFNSKTLEFHKNNKEAQIVVVTETLSVGINSAADTVINFGLPPTVLLVIRLSKIRRNVKGSLLFVQYNSLFECSNEHVIITNT